MIHWAWLILAFISGVLVGIGYTYSQYHKMTVNNLRELRLLQLEQEKIKCKLEIVQTIYGVEENL